MVGPWSINRHLNLEALSCVAVGLRDTTTGTANAGQFVGVLTAAGRYFRRHCLNCMNYSLRYCSRHCEVSHRQDLTYSVRPSSMNGTDLSGPWYPVRQGLSQYHILSYWLHSLRATTVMMNKTSATVRLSSAKLDLFQPIFSQRIFSLQPPGGR